MLTSIDVKFSFGSERLGLFSSANILQIADVALGVVLLLFLPWFQLLFRLVLTLEMSEMSAIFVFTTKTTQPRPQVLSVRPWRIVLLKVAYYDTSSDGNFAKFCQNYPRIPKFSAPDFRNYAHKMTQILYIQARNNDTKL